VRVIVVGRPGNVVVRMIVVVRVGCGGAVGAALFVGGMGLGTVLLWLVFAVNLGEFYALQSWLPTILAGQARDCLGSTDICKLWEFPSTASGYCHPSCRGMSIADCWGRMTGIRRPSWTGVDFESLEARSG